MKYRGNDLRSSPTAAPNPSPRRSLNCMRSTYRRERPGVGEKASALGLVAEVLFTFARQTRP